MYFLQDHNDGKYSDRLDIGQELSPNRKSTEIFLKYLSVVRLVLFLLSCQVGLTFTFCTNHIALC